MFKDYLANLRRIRRDARLMIATQAVMGFGYVGLYSVLFNLYLLRLDYDPAYIGQVNAIGRLGFALLGVPAGLLCVRFAPRPRFMRSSSSLSDIRPLSCRHINHLFLFHLTGLVEFIAKMVGALGEADRFRFSPHTTDISV